MADENLNGCICVDPEDGDPRAEPCGGQVTQEDFLCDHCREVCKPMRVESTP